MTQEQKDLLLKDLCARFPYGVKIDNMGEPSILVSINTKYKTIVETTEVDEYNCPKLDILEIEDVRPYLFPLSSMTDEQIYRSHLGYATMDTIRQGDAWSVITIGYNTYYDIVDWLNKNHFDYRGLIEKGLAIDATGLNIYSL